jgi:hypothetical protein
VLGAPALQSRLRDLTDRDSFVGETVKIAAELGLDLSPGDVDEALRDARRAWLERWV